MKKATRIMLTFLIVVPVLCFAQDKIKDNLATSIKSISKQEFKEFDRCNFSYEMKEKLVTSGKPIKKSKDTWTYAIKSVVMGMPVKAVEIGVCDDTGSLSCGWAGYVAVVIKMPFNEVKSYLKKKTGIDFTKEKRSDGPEVTLRPILVVGERKDESILFCDPGSL